jgi:hypothetical protein
MAESANWIFVRDIYELTTLEEELTWGRYKITPRGKQLMDDRLQSTYRDGMGYHIHANTLGQTKLGLDTAHLSQRISDQIDLKSNST